MKKNKKDVSSGKKFSHFMRHYFGYLLLAVCCAFVSIVIIGLCA